MAQITNLPVISGSHVIESVRLEPVLILLSLALGSWVAYKLFLRNVSPDRHRMFARDFRNLTHHVGLGLAVFVLYEALGWLDNGNFWSEKALVYLGLFAITAACIVFIKTLRIIAFEYLFMTSMKAGVPLLLVNIFTLAVTVVLIGWVLTNYFAIQLAPLLATSAVFSIVLGLALQDTLGNLFAAVALQFDKPFDLGDWIEVRNGTDRIAGQVREVSWRATLLVAITDEMITLPNRYMSQSQVLNFSGRERPFLRSHVFRLSLAQPLEAVRKTLLQSAAKVNGVLSDPPPVAIISETTESWVALKLVYAISDYGGQYLIADRFLSTALDDLRLSGVHLAAPRLLVERPQKDQQNEPQTTA